MTGDDCYGGLRIMVVEDNYLIAYSLAQHFEDSGATVVGPASTVQDALRLVREYGDDLDGASLDVHLGIERVFPVATALRERNIPFIFSTGYDTRVIPDEFQDAPRCEKPVDPARLMKLLERQIEAARLRKMPADTHVFVGKQS